MEPLGSLPRARVRLGGPESSQRNFLEVGIRERRSGVFSCVQSCCQGIRCIKLRWGNGASHVGSQLGGRAGFLLHPLPHLLPGNDHLVMLTVDGDLFTCGCGEQGQLGRVPALFAHRGGRRGLRELCRCSGTRGAVSFGPELCALQRSKETWSLPLLLQGLCVNRSLGAGSLGRRKKVIIY